MTGYYKPHPQFYCGNRPIYQAKIGTGPSALIAIKRSRSFWAGMKIEFYEYTVERKIPKAPKWKSARVDWIDGNRLFISL